MVSRIGQIIKVGDTLYESLGKMKAGDKNKKEIDKWKERYGADAVLRNGDVLYFCRTIIDVDFEDIKQGENDK